jgi:hypothetical protein
LGRGAPARIRRGTGGTGPRARRPGGGRLSADRPRPDDQVEPVGRGVLERDRDAVGLLDDRLDRVLEQIPHVVACRVVEDASQLAPHDLDVPPGDARDQPAHPDVDAAAVAPLEGDDLGPGAGSRHGGEHAGPFGHVPCWPDQVHRMAAGPHLGQSHPLHHGHRQPPPAEPEGRRSGLRRLRPRSGRAEDGETSCQLTLAGTST